MIEAAMIGVAVIEAAVIGVAVIEAAVMKAEAKLKVNLDILKRNKN